MMLLSDKTDWEQETLAACIDRFQTEVYYSGRKG
jgi:hypothetical protein